MRFFNKYFFTGVGVGVLLTIAIIVGAGFIMVKFMAPDMETIQAQLKPPTFPEHEKLSVYGTVDNDWSVQTLNGETMTFSDFKGKVVFVNFWATWCKPCIVEMPSIQNLYENFDSEEVVFLVISDEDKKTVRNFVQEKEYSFPVYLQKSKRPDVFKTRGIPATFIVSPEGRVVFKHVGGANWDDETCLRFIRGLM